MAPGQALPAAADEDPVSKISSRPSFEKANGDFKEPRGAVDLTCVNNCEDNVFYVEPPIEDRKEEDPEEQEVDIVEREGSIGLKPVMDEDPDATDHSSSFGGTFSGSGDAPKMDPSDNEVESKFSAENGCSSGLDECNRVFRKKRVTDHWRRFIHPLSWRCQWLELRMKELQSQALKYDKELEAYRHEKLLQTKVVELDDSASRLVPLTCQSRRKKAMRRRKRRRNEDTIDISSYMLNHNIFSYYEKKRLETENSVEDDCDDLADENINQDLEWSLLRFRRHDTCLEKILVDIEAAVSRVVKLKKRLNEVMCIHSREIASALGNDFPGEPLTVCSPSNDGDAMQVDVIDSSTNNLSDYEMDEVMMPNSAASSYGDAADPDFINEHELQNLCEEAAAGEELQDFEPASRVKEEPKSSAEESTAVAVETEEVLKPCYTGKKRGRKPKRRRGGLAAGSSAVKYHKVQKR